MTTTSCGRVVVVLAFAALLFGCGSGSSSGSSATAAGIGSGQDPDPVVVDFPLVYVDRPLLTDENGDLLTTDVRRPTAFFPGAQLKLRDRASPSAPDRVLSEGVFADAEDGSPPLYDVKDLAVSFSGTQLAFAMRAPQDPNLDEDDQPTWNIWLYDLETDLLRRVIESDIVAEAGQDIAPAFLPDGRLVFSSTRQRLSKAVLLDEGKPQFAGLDEALAGQALTLHVMQADGSDVTQITYNASSDLDPAVLGNGRLVYARWDNVADRDRISLYQANPDGTDQSLLYGVHSHDTGPNGEQVEFVEPIELPDGRLMVTLRPPGRQSRMGVLPAAIDTANFIEHDQPTFDNAGLLGDAQELLLPGELTLDENEPARQGRYAHIAPLYDGTNRLVVAWSQCRLRDATSDPQDPLIVVCNDENLANPDMVEAAPLYGIWMADLDEGTQQPIVVGVEGRAMSEVVVMEGRGSPPVILDKTPGIDLDPDLVSEAVGVLHIRSVYDFDGTAVENLAALSDPMVTTAGQRPARFVRLVKPVAIPDDDIVDLDGTAFGRSRAQLMREIIGYAPVEPDGSVKVKVPANVAFWVDVLDANGRRLGARHNNWMQLRPGEELECNGCHTPDSEAPHGRPGAQAPSANPGASQDGAPFTNTNPVLFADAGDSMAEVISRINGIAEPSVNLTFVDLWTDAALRDVDDSFDYNYRDLSTRPPVDPGCVSNWGSNCRIAIHYPEHIHPLWAVDRRKFDESDGSLIGDDTCVSCHSGEDEMGMPVIPAAQLDLSDGASGEEPAHLNSYRELLFDDNEQVVVNGALQDLLVPAFDENGAPLFELDAQGDPVLDGLGNPVRVMVPVAVTPSLSVAGALASPRFFSLFATGASHFGRLTEAELKLVSEWIDIGGQYYNDPFVVPQ